MNTTTELHDLLIAPAELLDELKAQSHEQSRAEGEIIDLGPLNGGQNEHLWNQAETAISLKRRLDAGEITEDYVAESLKPLEESYVPTIPGAAKRCVDGSTGEHYDDNDPDSYSEPLGPQIQGASGDEAVIQRLDRGFSADEAEVSFVDDLRNVSANRPNKSRFAEGGHTDDRANADTDLHADRTGCGAVDGQPRKMPKYGDAGAAPVISGTADAVYAQAGLEPPRHAFETMQVRVAELAERPGYFKSDPHDIIKVIQEISPHGLEKVVRPHNEVGVAINLVPNTTLHRNHFNARTDSEIQVFGLDAWNIIEEYGPEKGYALVADAVATLMDLTDGSLRLLVRRPRDNAIAVPA